MRWHFVTLLVFTVFASPVTSAPLEIKTINEAQLHGPMPTKEQINPTYQGPSASRSCSLFSGRDRRQVW